MRRILATVLMLSMVAPMAPARVPEHDWTWPVSGRRAIVEQYRAPAHRYGPGHRGIDIRVPAESGIRAPTSGIIAFSGSVAGRPLLTIDQGEGLVVTLEPVADAPPAGTAIAEGDLIGSLAVGGHARPGTLHVGVRWNGEYVNPLLFFGGVPRAVLVPCGGPC